MVDFTPNYPLIKLMNTVDWELLSKLIIPDLKKSTRKLKWWLGRKLKLRTHLGIYLLQQLLNETDREIERQVQDNAVYAVFCGKLFVNPNNEFCWLNAHIFQRNRLFFCRKRSWWTLIYQIFHCKDEMIWICTS